MFKQRVLCCLKEQNINRQVFFRYIRLLIRIKTKNAMLDAGNSKFIVLLVFFAD